MLFNASPEVVPFLDLVILSFMVCEYERRDIMMNADGPREMQKPLAQLQEY